MKSFNPIELTLVNGVDGDPAVYAFNQMTGEAFLFDLGSIERLAPRDILKIRKVFVSHTHVDHFIGFDRLLRTNIPHFRKIEICGPEGIAANVRAKLLGYNWNLVERDQLNFEIHEILKSGEIRCSHISNTNDFEIEVVDFTIDNAQTIQAPQPPAAIISQFDSGAQAHAISLDHGTDSVAYLYREPSRFKVVESALSDLELKPGPWIRELQIAAANGEWNKPLIVDGLEKSIAEWAKEILVPTDGVTYGYVTDIGFNSANLERLKLLFVQPDTLVCESHFRAEHKSRAQAKMHLTTRQSALIAANVGAKSLKTFHYSKLYSDSFDQVEKEAQFFLEQFRSLDADKLREATISEHGDPTQL